MAVIVDRDEAAVGQLIGTVITCTCEESQILGFLVGDRVYSWMGVPVGYRYGDRLTDLAGRTVAYVVSSVGVDGAGVLASPDIDWSRFSWQRYLPARQSILSGDVLLSA